MTIEGYLPKDYYYKLLKCSVCGSKFKGRGVRLTKGKQKRSGNCNLWVFKEWKWRF